MEFHLNRGDFKKWIREVWNYKELAEKISKIEKLNLKGEQLRTQIYKAVSNFLEFQKREKAAKTNIEEYLKKLPPPPEEHTYELKMERRLKHMLEEQEGKKKKDREQYGSSENSSV